MLIGSAVSTFLKELIYGVFRSLGDKESGLLGIPIVFDTRDSFDEENQAD